MPVGPGAVRLDSADLDGLGAQVVLANAYHLTLRPGADVAELRACTASPAGTGTSLHRPGGVPGVLLDPKVDDDGSPSARPTTATPTV